MKERDLQKTILDYLRLKKCLVFKHVSTGIRIQGKHFIPFPMGEKGISDIIGCTKKGQFLACEVKMKGNKATPAQFKFLKEVEEHGGIAILANSLDDVISQI